MPKISTFSYQGGGNPRANIANTKAAHPGSVTLKSNVGRKNEALYATTDENEKRTA
jgi:hypothetical protein